jgi:predicted TIM-barrel fold metal-dependent hydrolase
MISNLLPSYRRCFDVHTHLGRTLELNEAELDERIARSRYWRIERAVFLSNLGAGWPDWRYPCEEAVSAINSHCMKVVAKHPDFFTGFCYLNPANTTAFCLNEIERCIVKGGLKGLKFEMGLNAREKCYDPIMDRARQLRIPLLHHSFYNVNGNEHGESTPADIADLARRFPTVTIIAAHLNGGRERGVRDLMDLKNVLYDTSGYQSEAGLVAYAARKLGAHRLVYGSDVHGRGFGPQIGRVLNAGLSEDDQDRVLYRNLAEILGVEKSA